MIAAAIAKAGPFANLRARVETAKRVDPSGTGGIRRRYEAEYARRLRAVDLFLRDAIVARDALGIGPASMRTFAPKKPPTTGGISKPLSISAPSTPPAQKIESIMDYVRAVIVEVLVGGSDGVSAETEGGWTRTFIRSAYIGGVAKAQQAMRAIGETHIPAGPPTQTLNSVFHRQRLETLYSQNLAALRGISDDMAAKIHQIIADGLISGDNPKKIAREIRDRVDISIKRARVIARTEVIRANAEGELSSFEQFGATGVELLAEFITARDGNVCPICAAKSGRVYSIAEARGLVPQHPNCRCSWAPVQKKEQE